MAQLDWDVLAPLIPEPDSDSKQYEQISSEPKTLNSGNRQTFSGPLVMRTKNKDKYYNLFDAYVEVDFKLTRRDGTDMANDETNVGPTDVATLINGGWHLFDRATLAINNEIVEDVQLPGKCHLWNALTKYTPSEAEEVADSEFIYLDEYRQRQGAGGPAPAAANYSTSYKAVGWASPIDYVAMTQDDATAADVAIGGQVLYGTPDAQLKFNAGYAKRFARTRAGRTCRLQLPLRAIFGLAESQKPIRGVAVQVTLYKSNDYDHIIHSVYTVAAAAAQPVHATLLQTCSLWIPSVMPSKETEIEVESQLVDGASTTYQFISRTCYRSEVFESSTTRLEWDVGALVAKPLLAIIGFMSEGQYSIQYDTYGRLTSPVLSALFPATASALDAQTNLKAITAPLLIEEDTPANNIGGRIQNHCNNGGMTSHLNNIRRLAVRINDMPYPAEPYRMSFDDETTIRAYQDYLDVWGKGGESAKCLPYAVWKEMPLFCIRFHSPDAFYTDRANIMRVDTEVNSSPRSLAAAGDTPEFEAQHRGVYGRPISGPGSFQMYCLVYYEREINVSADSGYMRYAT